MYMESNVTYTRELHDACWREALDYNIQHHAKAKSLALSHIKQPRFEAIIIIVKCHTIYISTVYLLIYRTAKNNYFDWNRFL